MQRPKLPDDARYKALDRTMRKLGYDRHGLIETLHFAQETFGYLEDDVMRFIARSLGLAMSRVYGVATFYSHFTLKPKGEHVCVVCTGTACYIKGANKLIDTICKKHKIKDGQTTEDNKLSLLTARCVGSCGLAPLGVFDGRVAGFLDEEKCDELIEEMIR